MPKHADSIIKGQFQLKNRQGERFFLVMGLVLLGIVIGGFAPPVFARPRGVASLSLLLHVHGAVFVSWFLLFCMQAHLAGAGNIRLHMSLGKASTLIAAAMIVLGYFVIRAAYAKPDWNVAGMPSAASVMFPFTDIVNFTIAYGLAMANRRNPDAHKRLMLLAGLLIIDPATARLVFTLGLALPVIVILELALFGALIAYDLISRRRLCWATLLGLGLFVAALAAKLAVAQHPRWHSFVEFAFA